MRVALIDDHSTRKTIALTISTTDLTLVTAPRPRCCFSPIEAGLLLYAGVIISYPTFAQDKQIQDSIGAVEVYASNFSSHTRQKALVARAFIIVTASSRVLCLSQLERENYRFFFVRYRGKGHLSCVLSLKALRDSSY